MDTDIDFCATWIIPMRSTSFCRFVNGFPGAIDVRFYPNVNIGLVSGIKVKIKMLEATVTIGLNRGDFIAMVEKRPSSRKQTQVRKENLEVIEH